jgi:hypothetical protein
MKKRRKEKTQREEDEAEERHEWSQTNAKADNTKL